MVAGLDEDFDADEEEDPEGFQQLLEVIVPPERAGVDLAKEIHWHSVTRDPVLPEEDNLSPFLLHGEERRPPLSDQFSTSSADYEDSENGHHQAGDAEFNAVLNEYNSESEQSLGSDAESSKEGDTAVLEDFVRLVNDSQKENFESVRPRLGERLRLVKFNIYSDFQTRQVYRGFYVVHRQTMTPLGPTWNRRATTWGTWFLCIMLLSPISGVGTDVVSELLVGLPGRLNQFLLRCFTTRTVR